MTYSRATSNYRKPLTAASFIEELQLDSLPHLPEEEREAIRPSRPKVVMSDLKIRVIDPVTGVGSLKVLDPNDMQAVYLDMLAEEYEGFDWRNEIYTLTGLREDILKARQQGMSTIILALYFLNTINNPYVETHIYAHDGPTTLKLFEVVERFYKHLPEEKKPPLRRSNRKEIVFDDTDSGIFVGMVGGKSLGRGGTVNNAHISERAWNTRYAELEIGLTEAISHAGNITRETTANGLGEYHELRKEVMAGKTRFRGRFFPWYLTKHYRLPVPDNFIRTKEEEQLASVYGLDDEQLEWRRDKKSADKGNKFEQEYPINEEEAFIGTGKPFFDQEALRLIRIELARPEYAAKTGIVWTREDYPLLKESYKNGDLIIYAFPEDEEPCLITADTAEGVNQDDDADAAGIYSIYRRRKLASLHGYWDTKEYGRILVELGYAYNTALLVVERNNTGYAVIQSIMAEEYPNQRGNGTKGLYHHDANLLDSTRPQSNETRKPGWPTLTNTKAFALAKLQTAVDETQEDIVLSRFFCPDSIGEMMTFAHLGSGKVGGEGSAHDDRVTEQAIAAAVLSLKFEKEKEGRRENLPEPRLRTAYGGRGRR